MKAIILAAGVGSRLKPLTDNTPKCLLKAGDKTILERILDNIIANNLNDVVIVTGYLANQIKAFVSIRYPGLSVTYIHNEVYGSTNNIYSLWLTKDNVLGHEMLLMDSDIVFDKDIIGSLLTSGYENCLALKKHHVQDEEIKVKAENSGKVLEIGKDVLPEDAIGESIGIEKFGVRTLYNLFDIIDRKIRIEKNVNQFYEVAFQELIRIHADIFAVDVTDYICMEIDTPHDLKTADKMLLNQL